MTVGSAGAVTKEAMLPRPFRVVEKRRETPDTVTIIFEAEDGMETSFRPGQFMMIYVFGVGEVPISLAGNPHVAHFVEHTVRAVGAVTQALADLDPGAVVGIRGPYGTSWPLDLVVNRDLLIIAGGIGLAPLRPAVMESLNRRDELNSLALLYGARTPTDLLYKADLLGWEGTPAVNVEVTVDKAPLDWFGDVGLVTNLLHRVDFKPANTSAFVCGPEVMMRVVARELRNRGVPEQNISISLERNMKCAIGFCGHCQYGQDFLCHGGPVGPYTRFADRLRAEEL